MITRRNSYFIDKHISFYTNKKDDFLESHIKIQDDLEEQEEDNSPPNINEIFDNDSRDDDEENNSEHYESDLYDEEDNNLVINNNINNNINIPFFNSENHENININSDTGTVSVYNPFLENSLLQRNYDSAMIARAFSYHTDVDSLLFDEIFNELYNERHRNDIRNYNDISNNILNNENVNTENANIIENKENESTIIEEDDEEQKDTDSIS